MKNVLTFLGAAAVAVGLSAAAVSALSSDSQAEEPMHPKVGHSPPAFAEVDADRDGMVTATEFLTFIEARRAVADFSSDGGADRFAKADANGDGVLSREEYEAAPRKFVHRRFHMHDPRELFAKADTDGDSVLNEEEFNSLFEAMHRHRLRRHPADSGAHDTP